MYFCSSGVINSNIVINLNEDVFIPTSVINELRRSAIEKLNNSRINKKVIRNKKPTQINPKNHELLPIPELTIEVSTLEQYEYVKSLGYQNIYFS